MWQRKASSLFLQPTYWENTQHKGDSNWHLLWCKDRSDLLWHAWKIHPITFPMLLRFSFCFDVGHKNQHNCPYSIQAPKNMVVSYFQQCCRLSSLFFCFCQSLYLDLFQQWEWTTKSKKVGKYSNFEVHLRVIAVNMAATRPKNALFWIINALYQFMIWSARHVCFYVFHL